MFGSMAVYVTVQRNMQGEAIDQVTGVVDYAYLSMLFMSSVAIVGATAGIPVALVIWALVVCIRGSRRE